VQIAERQKACGNFLARVLAFQNILIVFIGLSQSQ